MGRLRVDSFALFVCWLLVLGCHGEEQPKNPTAGQAGGDGAATGGGQGDGSSLPVGAPCVPGDERQSEFGGAEVTGVTLAMGHPACSSGLCLVNHFQGRVTCPYGQTEQDLTLPPDDGRRCRVADEATGEIMDEPVTRSVFPQLAARRAEDVVLCSCRCAGPDPEVEYCSCPEGTECTPLIQDLGLGPGDIAGSYCIKVGTAYDESAPSGPLCSKDAASAETDCGNDRRNP